MKRRITCILMVVIAACVCSCRNDIFPEFVSNPDVHIEMNGNTILRYDEVTCQMGFNRDRRQFRMSTDSMSDYFSITMNMIPVIEGETIKGDLVWTTDRDVVTRKNIALEVVKTEDDKFWLWNEQERIALVIEILD